MLCVVRQKSLRWADPSSRGVIPSATLKPQRSGLGPSEALCHKKKKQIHLSPKLHGYGNNGQRSFNEWDIIHLLTTKYILKLAGTCSVSNINTYSISNYYPSDVRALIKKKLVRFLKIFLGFRRILRSTRAAVSLGFAVGTGTDLRNVQIKLHAEHTQYIEPQGDHIFLSRQYLRISQTSNIGTFCYIDVT
jgi:hypothetical protein